METGHSSSNWTFSGNCRTRPADEMFVTGAQQNVAKRICQGCPVKPQCLAEALDNRIEYGVWGGMTERERRAVLRRHPNVRSWKRIFQREKKAQAKANPS